MDEPRTAAGRALLDSLPLNEWHPINREIVIEHILAIEAEAAAPDPVASPPYAAIGELTAALVKEVGVAGHYECLNCGTDVSGRPYKHEDGCEVEVVRAWLASKPMVFFPKDRAVATPALLDVPGWLIARAARSIHLSGEGDECEGEIEALWCRACWDEAVAWTDPNTTQPGLLEVDAEYERLGQPAAEEPEPDPRGRSWG